MTKPLHTPAATAIRGTGRCPRCGCRNMLGWQWNKEAAEEIDAG